MKKMFIKTIYKDPNSNSFWQEVGQDAKTKVEISEPELPQNSKEEAEIFGPLKHLLDWVKFTLTGKAETLTLLTSKRISFVLSPIT